MMPNALNIIKHARERSLTILRYTINAHFITLFIIISCILGPCTEFTCIFLFFCTGWNALVVKHIPSFAVNFSLILDVGLNMKYSEIREYTVEIFSVPADVLVFQRTVEVRHCVYVGIL